MLFTDHSPIELNVTVTVLDENRKLVKRSKFKNTATQRMTEGIAMFLAGDSATEHRGKWRPNFVSFATTGITKQPFNGNPAEFVDNFEDKNPEPGQRSRPWFYSKSLGEKLDGFWNPEYCWGTKENPDEPVFQGELVTAVETEYPIRRHPLLRADVTADSSYLRDFGIEGYSSDCILYAYSSVLWNQQFFNTPEGTPKIDRMAISEVGLYEMDSDTRDGQRSLMAGFRVPTVNDVIYVEPGYVVLVEWRITIRALMPYEGVHVAEGIAPTGIAMYIDNNNTNLDEGKVQFVAVVRGPEGVSQKVQWLLEGAKQEGTALDENGLLTIDPTETSNAIYIKAISTVDPNINATSAVLQGKGSGINSADSASIAVSIESISELSIKLHADVVTTGNYSDKVHWSLCDSEHPGTHIDENTGEITFDYEETSDKFTVQVTLDDDDRIFAQSAIVRIDKTKGDYVISDFSIMT